MRAQIFLYLPTTFYSTLVPFFVSPLRSTVRTYLVVYINCYASPAYMHQPFNLSTIPGALLPNYQERLGTRLRHASYQQSKTCTRPILQSALATKMGQATTESYTERMKHTQAKRHDSKGLPSDKRENAQL